MIKSSSSYALPIAFLRNKSNFGPIDESDIGKFDDDQVNKWSAFPPLTRLKSKKEGFDDIISQFSLNPFEPLGENNK
jgi:hypothetical protein